MEEIRTPGFCPNCKKEVMTVRPTQSPDQRKHKILSLLSLGFWPYYDLRVGWRCAECGKKADNEKPHLVGRSLGGLRSITYIERIGFCQNCNKSVVVRRQFLSPNSPHQVLSLATKGTWPVKWSEIKWFCKECGRNTDNEKLYPAKEQMDSTGYCSHCNTDMPIQRNVPNLKLPHKWLSALTLGRWPYKWIYLGWSCTSCGQGADDRDALTPKDVIDAKGFCQKCGGQMQIRRKTPTFNFFQKILTLITLGYWSRYWLRSRWRCTTCDSVVTPPLFENAEETPPSGPEKPVTAEETIESSGRILKTEETDLSQDDKSEERA